VALMTLYTYVPGKAELRDLMLGSVSTTAIGRSPSSSSGFSASLLPSLASGVSLLWICSQARRSRTLTHMVMDHQLQITPVDR